MDQRECARLETRDGQPVHLLGVKLSGDLRGLMFEASIEQRFCNPGDKNVEVAYSFPLPWGAVLLGVDVVLGDKHLTARSLRRKRLKRATRKPSQREMPRSCLRRTVITATA